MIVVSVVVAGMICCCGKEVVVTGRWVLENTELPPDLRSRHPLWTAELVFNKDGSVRLTGFGKPLMSGRYTVSGQEVHISWQADKPMVSICAVRDNRLTVTIGEIEMVFVRPKYAP